LLEHLGNLFLLLFCCFLRSCFWWESGGQLDVKLWSVLGLSVQKSKGGNGLPERTLCIPKLFVRFCSQ
jgi:hypothetical protein